MVSTRALLYRTAQQDLVPAPELAEIEGGVAHEVVVASKPIVVLPADLEHGRGDGGSSSAIFTVSLAGEQ